MKIAYRVSEQDFVGARKLFIANEKPWYRRLSRRPLPWVGASVLVMQVIYLFVEPHRDIGFVVIGFSWAFIFCTADSHCHVISAAPIKKTIALSTTSPLKFQIKASTLLLPFPMGN